MTHSLLVPFLNQDSVYCHGVEYGMSVVTRMLNGDEEIRGYFRTENEEQIRLTCYRLNYEIKKLKPWRFEGKSTGWVWMVLGRRADLVGGAGI